MLDGSYYVECVCGADEHTLRFVLDKKDREIYLSVFLNQHRGFFKRFWIALKYLFVLKSKYGHWVSAILWEEQVVQLQKMIDSFNNLDSEQS